jgi:hypothetical protein
MIVLPLRGSVARPLRDRLQDSGTASTSADGTVAPTGPVTVLVTPRRQGGSFLLAGTVRPEVAQRAARELLAAG